MNYDFRLLEAIDYGRRMDRIILDNYLRDKNLTRTARHFKLSEAEIRYIVTSPEKEIPAGGTVVSRRR